MNELQLTRENVIDIEAQVDALIRKSQCRAVNQDVIAMLDEVSVKLRRIDNELTKIIGD